MTDVSKSTHDEISPAILYWGTPVCLITTTIIDGSYNIAPMSSIFRFGRICMVGLDEGSQTTENTQRTGHCILDLATASMKDAVNVLARITGSFPVSDSRSARCYTYIKDKFSCANITPLPSTIGSIPRMAECPVTMEARLVAEHSRFKVQPTEGAVLSFELHITGFEVLLELKLEGYQNRIDTDKWKPIIMMFSELYGLGNGKAMESVLVVIEEEMYRPFTGTTG
ncbi:hypothetical protein DE146DRAFT_752636 [Phaeosphaeria sp. MPI-PUGE-AT-0046c]|nr:hypothetical protein DE146DRAFT_752636 [Phaeosphaeria sp. MPI-PUGE-AT-0046c]